MRVGPIGLGFILALSTAAQAQPRRPGADGGLDIRAVSPAVERALQLARSAIERGEHAQAITQLDALPLADRRSEAVSVVRAMALWDSLGVPVEPGGAGMLAPAARRTLSTLTGTLRPWVASHPDDALASQTLGRALLSQDDLPGAEIALASFTRLRPRDPVGWNDLAMVRVALRRLPEAQTCLESAVALAPEDAEPWANLGAVRLARGDAPRAIVALRTAVERAPDRARHHADLGAAYLAAGDVPHAIESLQRAVALRPNEGPLLANLGYALHLGRRSDEALDALRRATVLSPRSVTGWNNLAAVLAARGDRPAAREALARARALSPDDPRLRAQQEALDAPEASGPAAATPSRTSPTLPR